jgi:UPF0271 protein
MTTIDLNCDMGESFGAYTIGADEAVMASITSANVACGYHGGDPSVMRRTIRLAREAGLRSEPILDFPIWWDSAAVKCGSRRGTSRTWSCIRSARWRRLPGVKGQPLARKGAMVRSYNMAVTDNALAGALARAVMAVDPALIFFALPGSELARAASALDFKLRSKDLRIERTNRMER